MSFRVEESGGHFILCGGLIAETSILPGQLWKGSGRTLVEVVSVEDGWVTYKWEEKGETRTHEKDQFAFQCRYCLVLPDGKIPEGWK